MRNNKGFILPLLLIILGVLVIVGISFGIYRFRFQPKAQCIGGNMMCEGKPDGTSCQYGKWCDEKGRVCGGQNCVGLGLGVCSSGKCQMEEKTTDETANWETYTNSKLGFSLKYPTDLSIKETNNSITFDNYQKFGIEDPSKAQSPLINDIEPQFVGINITLGSVDKNKSLEDYLNEKFPDSPEVTGIPSYKAEKSKGKIESVTVDGLSGISVKESYFHWETVERLVWVKKGDKLFEFTVFGCGETPPTYSKVGNETFDQILSTFKFL
jgi:hypothetical protein